MLVKKRNFYLKISLEKKNICFFFFTDVLVKDKKLKMKRVKVDWIRNMLFKGENRG